MKHLIPFALFMLMPAHGFSQQYISYDYDASGNRTQSMVSVQRQNARRQEAGRNLEIQTLPGGGSIDVCQDAANGRLTIRTDKMSGDVCSYALFGMDGSLVCCGEILGTATSVDMTGCAAGVYILKITSNSEQTVWKLTKKNK